MNLSHNFVSFIDSLGVVQGLLFGTMLLLLHYKKNKPTLFLALFIILFSLEPVPNILEEMGVLTKYPKWELIPVQFHFLAFPLFYIYIQRISILSEQKVSYWILIPGIIEFVTALIVFFLPIDVKQKIKLSSFATIYFVLGLLYTLYISYLVLRWIQLHSNEVAEQFSEINHKTLNWSKWFVIASIVFHVLLLTTFFTNNRTFYIMVSIFNVVLIYWLSYKGITQQKITALIWSPRPLETQAQNTRIPFLNIPKEPLNLTSKSNNQDLLTAEQANDILEAVDEYVKSSECFINDKLTIIDIAEATNIHPKRISHSINSVRKVNFNHFINSYRVVYAKKLLKSDTTKHLSIEGIGLEAGFHSKTTFYSAFRKIEGMTPAQYKSS